MSNRDRAVCLLGVTLETLMGNDQGVRTAPAPALAAKERILSTAYELFTRRGVRAVGIDEVIAVSPAAKATLYRHFPTKNDLILAVLRRREQLWTLDLVEKQSRLRGNTPEEQLLAIFDVFGDWFGEREDFEGCSFINVLLEMGADHPAGQASMQYLENIRAIVRQRAEAAGLVDVDNFARSWHILMKGSIISANEGDLEAANLAKAMARRLIDEHRPAES
jgi:AcrR family transcriptional regulator